MGQHHDTRRLALGLVRTSDANRKLIEGWVRSARPAMRGALAALEPLWEPYKSDESYDSVAALDAQLEKRWRRLGLDVGPAS